MKVDITVAADAELADAYEHYLQIAPDLGVDFFAEYRAAVQLVVEMPLTWTKLADGIHRRTLKRFPYAIVYEVHSDRHLTILSVFHLRQKPRRWRI